MGCDITEVSLVSICEYLKVYERVPSASAFNDALNVLCGFALRTPGHFDVAIRVGEANGVIYVDLCDAERDIVAVSPGKWRIVRKSPIRFKRPRGTLALPRPERGGSINALRHYLNVPNGRKAFC